MNFLNNQLPNNELTYNDVFMVPQLSNISSRSKVDLATPDNIGTSLPIVVANMNAVSGKRMAETVARRGGIAVLPQDLPLDIITKMIKYIKTASILYETPVTLAPHDNIAKAIDLIHKRAHGAVIVVDNENRPIGIFTENDAIGLDRFTRLEKIISNRVISIKSQLTNQQAYDVLEKNRLFMAPIVDDTNKLIGAVTKKGLIRNDIYHPALDKQQRLMVAAAIGINGHASIKAKQLFELGADMIVIDTAHGHQQNMIDCITNVRRELGSEINIIAGNVATADATFDLIKAGANIVKVGIGPGAMCTTRMMTGVGRPQFSAILECAAIAKQNNAHVWADGGIRHPRDIALALAAGASNVMFGSWFAGTYESAADILQDNDGRYYKENFGMASRRAVRGRNENESSFERSKKELFEEGISASRSYIDPSTPGVEDIIDKIVAGLKSSLSYTGANNIAEFQQKVIVGTQTAAGYNEGLPISTNW